MTPAIHPADLGFFSTLASAGRISLVMADC